MRKKRGQAAMEFLMTYGWAILAAVIVVGVLWYLIGNPSNLAGDKFQMSKPFVANAMSLNATGVEIELRNGEAESVNVTLINMTDTDCALTPSGGWEIAAGELETVFVTCASGLSSGDRFNSDVVIRYLKANSGVVQTATGQISGTVP